MFGPSLENRCYGSIPNMSHTVHLPVARSSPGHHEPVGADQGPPTDQGASVWRLRLWHASADVEDGIVPGGHVHCQSSVGLAVLDYSSRRGSQTICIIGKRGGGILNNFVLSTFCTYSPLSPNSYHLESKRQQGMGVRLQTCDFEIIFKTSELMFDSDVLIKINLCIKS